MSERFCVGWVAGPSAQVELFSPSVEQAGIYYRMKYTPAFRSTIRPPVEDLRLGEGELDPVNQSLNELVAALDARSAHTEEAPEQPRPASELASQMALIGEQLLFLLIPNYVQVDLRVKGLFLEIGMDEKLLAYPWELMHDGEDFMCLKHAMGRFVNTSVNSIIQAKPMYAATYTSLGVPLEVLSILVISVPNPQPRGNITFTRLPEADSETEKIIELLNHNENVEVELIKGRQATFDAIFQTLRRKKYQIIHFCGHANFNDLQPYRSGLVLYDRDLTTGALMGLIGGQPPVLCFVNACDTARSVEKEGWTGRYNLYGLARAFLDTGAYLLGSRWKISDKTASEFAGQFYSSLVIEGKSIGEAVLEARQACRRAVPEDPFGWASYSLYGDPRVGFLKQTITG